MAKPLKSVFVVMPFVKVNGGVRTTTTLAAFFKNHLKRPIESAHELAYRYSVTRSGESFNITKDIIRSICSADIVIADISGTEPNSNVMYELGVRLAVSERPVILIKEGIAGVSNPFDVFGYYTQSYDPLDYTTLEEHIVSKLRRFETGEEVFDNEVLRLIREQLRQQQPDLTNVSPARQRELVLSGVRTLGDQISAAFGPAGLLVQGTTNSGAPRLLSRGIEIASDLPSSNHFENEGVKLLRAAVEEAVNANGNGSKMAAIVTRGMLDATASWQAPIGAQLASEVEAAGQWCIDRLNSLARPADEVGWNVIARTAAKSRELPLDFDALMTRRATDGVVAVEDGTADRTTVVQQEHYRLDRGPSHDDFLIENGGTRLSLAEPLTLAYAGDISSMRDLLPILEIAAGAKRPLLIVANKVEGEAQATLLVNLERQALRCVPINASGFGARRSGRLNDFAVLTGAKLVDPGRGDQLSSTTAEDLGSAKLVLVSKHWTEVQGGAGRASDIRDQIERLHQLATDAPSEYERETLVERIAQLAGRHQTILIGGHSTEKRLRNRDVVSQALAAAFAAVRGGAVIGGASALAAVARSLIDEQPAVADAIATQIVAEGLRAPLVALIQSRQGETEPILSSVEGGVGRMVYDASIGVCVQADQSGIADPLAVLTCAIHAATGIVSGFLRTGIWRPGRSGEQATL